MQPRSDEVADAVFADRPRKARAVALASCQSATLDDEQRLREDVARLDDSDDRLPRPDHWTVYELLVDEIEFWSGSTDRLHQRLHYRRDGDRWASRRLQP